MPGVPPGKNTQQLHLTDKIILRFRPMAPIQEGWARGVFGQPCATWSNAAFSAASTLSCPWRLISAHPVT
ncbi:hypothetical protein GCM10010176_107460 [Nonomuraea spiralis]|nr:hypothetical protein GCM10010176_107460 [Nonomuraea spiralis]